MVNVQSYTQYIAPSIIKQGPLILGFDLYHEFGMLLLCCECRIDKTKKEKILAVRFFLTK